MLREALYFEDIVFRIESLMVYRNFQEDEVIKEFMALSYIIAFDKDMQGVNKKYFDFVAVLIRKAEELGFSGNIFKKYVMYLFLHDVNVFSLACEKKDNIKKSSLYKIVLKDVKTLQFLMNLEIDTLCENLGHTENIKNYSSVKDTNEPYFEQLEFANSVEALTDALSWYYNKMGCGHFATCKMSKFDEVKGIVGIKHSDPITFDKIIGCKEQKQALIDNTEAFLSGSPANNVLLVGSRGTGKSSCVKALANEYFDRGLRLIELTKDQTPFISPLINELADRAKHYIIFIDDLSFDDFEIQYKHMKSLLEGSVESRPANVLFYATSNRRHIIQERWIDKKDNIESDEIHTTDTVNEKLSLADRFGVTITFPKPNPQEYMNIVVGIAKSENLRISESFLKEQAMKWELNQSSLSGRTARQFMNSILWEMKKE